MKSGRTESLLDAALVCTCSQLCWTAVGRDDVACACCCLCALYSEQQVLNASACKLTVPIGQGQPDKISMQDFFRVSLPLFAAIFAKYTFS